MSSNFIQSGNQSNPENFFESTGVEELSNEELLKVVGGAAYEDFQASINTPSITNKYTISSGLGQQSGSGNNNGLFVVPDYTSVVIKEAILASTK